eukprot:TRINITY_DN831_c0_g5_i1.p1 TRINITY_DN831_c0_g5~~TRINITY_DN831_c0_g5_i1.p1  ORF type:complete len:416 (-),score=54.24 TRINITY_DN831_c0_g5_i1:563-1810(-)
MASGFSLFGRRRRKVKAWDSLGPLHQIDERQLLASDTALISSAVASATPWVFLGVNVHSFHTWDRLPRSLFFVKEPLVVLRWGAAVASASCLWRTTSNIPQMPGHTLLVSRTVVLAGPPLASLPPSTRPSLLNTASLALRSSSALSATFSILSTSSSLSSPSLQRYDSPRVASNDSPRETSSISGQAAGDYLLSQEQHLGAGRSSRANSFSDTASLQQGGEREREGAQQTEWTDEDEAGAAVALDNVRESVVPDSVLPDSALLQQQELGLQRPEGAAESDNSRNNVRTASFREQEQQQRQALQHPPLEVFLYSRDCTGYSSDEILLAIGSFTLPSTESLPLTPIRVPLFDRLNHKAGFVRLSLQNLPGPPAPPRHFREAEDAGQGVTPRPSNMLVIMGPNEDLREASLAVPVRRP